MSARAGSGIVVARLPNGQWSPPAAIGIGGLGGGFNAGAEVVDFLIVLNSRAAVRSFMASGSLQLGGNLSLAIGPLGRTGEASAALSAEMEVSAMFSYSVSRGLYGGATIEGTFLIDRSATNARAYGRNVLPKDILSGQVKMPIYAKPLINRLNQISSNVQHMEDASTEYAAVQGDDDDAYVMPSQYQSRPSSQSLNRADIDSMDDLDRQLQATSLGHKAPDTSKEYAGLANNQNNHNKSHHRLKHEYESDDVEEGDPFADPSTHTYERTYEREHLSYQPRQSKATGASNTAHAAMQQQDPVADYVDPALLDGDLVVALHDFEPQEEGDLAFKRGDILRVLHRTDNLSDWWTGEHVVNFGSDKRTAGTFPSNYTEPL